MKKTLLLFLLLHSIIALSQQRDKRVREYIPPVRIVWQQGDTLIKGADNLLLPGNGQADMSNTNLCVLRSTESECSALLLDFGKELQGGIQLVTGMPSSSTPVEVRIRFGESVSEAMSDIGEKGATNDHAMRDFTVKLPWLGVMEVGNSGFRFARIDLVTPSTELHLKEARAIFSYRDIAYKGSFRCNDERLNKIWQTGAYTVHLNMQDYLWDGIKRDRLVWVGDLHPEVMTINSVFGYNECVPKSLDLIRDITPLPSWMNGISSYSIWWILIQRDWYYYQGDIRYLKKQQAYLTDLLRLLISKTDKDGKEQLDGHRFLDWPSSENKEAIDAGLQALMIMAFRAGEELCAILGEFDLATQCNKAAKKALKASSKVQQALVSSSKEPDAPGSKQAAALMALAGMMPADDADSKYLSVNNAKGFSTFYGYYMLRAMAAADNYQGALDVIRRYWGAMLDLGATTFWEDFNIDWLTDAGQIDELIPEGKKDIHGDYGDYCYKGFRHSLCHGWASGPTSWLSEYVLGVQVIEPGCSKVRIKPNLGDLQWVEGSFPTPKGIISIRHEKKPDGQIESSIKAPEGIIIVKD
ncbi:alpha-L-rhamnosidase [Parabacteroides sp. PF5-5]|uniref:alpha-L-rhamnosidase-related protein n=1 Tax=unclassified Parabacteroides TaxID=2649774 RepID=UPI002473629D|nr:MULTISPECIES: alpha-L-rhamnosidase C-terminal domain-containing protein [unclassified Parabacteroides]MDH6303784.1 alpha-L-rhamnosidase [Parabacteroides sp. PH5-39]MDH6314401.1 alpha-L-rhamnosidase [Parabacteroides sp. PF5-13]MDH6318534.1 alpha-L-rhamnosidase [Parabacteroides sp. PH5-13]MDH6322173.1 alpha-L-rhamnosidase [Parabacteroides sp. PH5-8]MDH6325747.1 alpha-L-rhamnosidase [Parabacteroides sp. PH5-41]